MSSTAHANISLGICGAWGPIAQSQYSSLPYNQLTLLVLLQCVLSCMPFDSVKPVVKANRCSRQGTQSLRVSQFTSPGSTLAQ